jgi:hypothetical protein
MEVRCRNPANGHETLKGKIIVYDKTTLAGIDLSDISNISPVNVSGFFLSYENQIQASRNDRCEWIEDKYRQ